MAMQQINLDLQGERIDDSWQVITDPEQEVIEPNSIIPLALWLEHRDRVAEISPLGVWLDSDQEPETIADQLDNFPLVAINFPTFMDGRGFSIARLLRERYGYEGDIRAIGNVIPDQLYFMKRCGFSSFALAADTNIDSAVACLRPFTNTYQAAVDDRQPLYRRRG